MDSAVTASGLTKTFGTQRALDEVSFELPGGSFTALFGANGAGKTTLLRTLATLSRPSAGTATVCGIDLLQQPKQVRARIGFLGHEPLLYPDLTAAENLTLYARLYGIKDPQQRAAELLETVGLTRRADERAGNLSRGMLQRLAIARALAGDAELLLLDEPFSGLDPNGLALIEDLLAELSETRSIIMSCHDPERGYALADHLLVLEDGRLTLCERTQDCSLDELRGCLAGAAATEAGA